MLPKKNRLVKQTDFKLLAQKGRGYYSPFFTLKVLKDSGGPIFGHSLFGIVISARVSKKAVVRNRLKRQIAEIIRLRLDGLKPGYKIMILAKPILVGKEYLQIKEQLEKYLTQAKIL